ncbi:MAG: helix-turn-helix transcriptional regulator [Planctomycetota bacterium]|jgi:transcriptional regulator with XRE-family HTH domain
MKDIKYKKISNCLRKYRKLKGLKQKDVARILKLKSTSMISRWEKGTVLPNSLNIFRLSLLYRTLIDVLFIDLMRLLKEDLRKREEKVLRVKDKKEVKNER